MSQTLSFSWDWEAQNFPSPGTWVTNPSQAKVTMNSDKWVSEWVGMSSFSAARVENQLQGLGVQLKATELRIPRVCLFLKLSLEREVEWTLNFIWGSGRLGEVF